MSGARVDTDAAPPTDAEVVPGEGADTGGHHRASDPEVDGHEQGTSRPVHRLRDLDRRGRWAAAAFAAALLLAPVLAFAWAVPEWVPAGDPARMALRALDVGTEDTPLTGLPSTSALYVGGDRHVDHPGPVHYYMLAPAIRLLGAPLGMLVVSLVIVSTSLLVAAWATFRQLGPRGGVLATVILSAITFTTGAATLVNPVSSNIARYPFLASVVLLWCLLCGDLRLLPLAAVMVSFAAQQHLSVLPTMIITTVAVGGLAGAAWLLRAWPQWRRSRSRRSGPGEAEAPSGDERPARRARVRDWLHRPAGRDVTRWGGLAAVAGLVLWSPVLVQQLFGSGGNLTRMVRFALHDERPTLGYRSSVRQVAHTLGLPPIVGQLELSGVWFLEEVSLLTWVSAAVVAAGVAVVGWRWYRQGLRRQATLAVMAGVLAFAGLVNGASVPEGIETIRLPLYHWAWPLVFFVVMTLGVAGLDLVGRLGAVRRRPGVPTAPVALLALAVVVVPSVVNPSLDRESNTLLDAYAPVEHHYIAEVADAVLAERDLLDQPTLLLSRENAYDGLHQALALELTERGLPVLQPHYEWQSVGQRRVVDPNTVRSGLVLVVDSGFPDPADDRSRDVPGELIVDVSTETDFDVEAFETLVAEIEGTDDVVIGDDLTRAVLDTLPDSAPRGLADTYLDSMLNEPRQALLNPGLVDLLRDHPPERPRLDPDLLDRVRNTLPDWPGPYRLRVYRLDLDELLSFAAPDEIPGRPPAG